MAPILDVLLEIAGALASMALAFTLFERQLDLLAWAMMVVALYLLVDVVGTAWAIFTEEGD